MCSFLVPCTSLSLHFFTVTAAPPKAELPEHDSVLVSWMETELGVFDAPLSHYIVCWKQVDDRGDDLPGNTRAYVYSV